MASASSATASLPGAVRMSRTDNFWAPGEASGAMLSTGRARVRTALRNRRKTIGDSSSGSKPASSTIGAVSRSA